ncbi:MAG: type I glyceraldehyde-3-phosphate dehydrogenase [Bacteroidetes bacterium]|nr:type I glyceraldehyde-3-phosphate dehydrogenase [Bacteroidota bacterium]MBR3090587.1 type I glyceraldehyde-3-phosphate dehydrogenase [Bacteroidota bacterium]
MKLAINGFGRIGRLVFRQLMYRNADVEVVGINDLTDANTLAHLLRYDSVHGLFNGSISVEGNYMIVNGKKVLISAERSIESIPWKDVDVVLESTGVYTDKESLEKHLASSGAKKVVLSAPAKGTLDATVVLGVNDNILTGKEKTLSNASCTTNCLAPMVKVLNDKFGVESGFMCTVHAYTNDQRILDLPHKDLRRARSAAINSIPTTTGAAKAVGLVIPELQGKLQGYSIRVPLPDGSITDFTAVLKTEVTKEDINNAMKEASETYLKGIMEYSTDPLVSTDILGNPHSCIFDSSFTDVIGGKGKFVKVVGWYDNEFGYSNRIADLILKIGK